MCRHKVDDALVLVKSQLNVRAPCFADLADNLPGSWKGNICDYDKRKGVAKNLHPDEAWLDRFWALVSDTGNFPSELSSYMVVPLTMPKKPGKMRLASPDYCQQRCAITTSVTKALPPSASDIVAALGCLCILTPEADCASPQTDKQEPLTTALAAASAHLGRPLSEMVSANLTCNGCSFGEVRQFLANHVYAKKGQQGKV